MESTGRWGKSLRGFVARVEEATATHKRAHGVGQRLPSSASLLNQLSVTCARFNVEMVRALAGRVDGLFGG